MNKIFGTWIFLMFFVPFSWGATIFVGDGGEDSAPTTESETSSDKETEVDDLDADPFEPINRKIFYFNEIVDGVLIDPVANMYKMAMPFCIQKAVSHGLFNLGEPLTFTNDFLQARGTKALESFSRFLINTIFGFGGIFDVAESLGLPKHKESFNTTLKYWGVPTGPYLIVPILGPSNPRFLAGLGGDYIMDPVCYYMREMDEESLIWARVGVTFMVTRADITDDIRNFRENSIDFYAAMRSFYKQYMSAERRDNGELVHRSPSLDEFMVDDIGL